MRIEYTIGKPNLNKVGAPKRVSLRMSQFDAQTLLHLALSQLTRNLEKHKASGDALGQGICMNEIDNLKRIIDATRDSRKD